MARGQASGLDEDLRDIAAQRVLRSTRAGVSSLITGAVASKLLNFAANVIVTRSVGKQGLGAGSLRLDDFLFLGPLVLVREGLRKAAYRVDSSGRPDMSQSLVNLSWATAPVTLLLVCVFACSLLVDTPDVVAKRIISMEKYHRAMGLTALAVVLALISEPMFLLAQSQLLTAARARIETWATMGKCLAMVVGTVFLGLTIEAFAISNIVYALSLLVGYLILFACGHGKKTGLPRPLRLSDGVSFWDKDLSSTARTFWWQSAQKWLLENGEKVLLIFSGTDDQQDAYVVVSRLGSIVVRILFQPSEEMSLAAFAKLMALERAQDVSSNKDTAKGRDSTLVTRLVHSTLQAWLLLLGLIGLTFAVFGPAYSHLLMHLLYGATWSATNAPTTMAAFSVYVLFMALNGICEAFVQGTSTPRGLSIYNVWMIVFSVLYIGAAFLLLPRFGAVGLVLANIFKMSCRITVCTVAYMRPYFRERTMPDFTISQLLPSNQVLVAYAVSAVVLQCSLRYVYHSESSLFTADIPFGGIVKCAIHVAVGLVCLAVVGTRVFRSHRGILDPIYSRGVSGATKLE